VKYLFYISLIAILSSCGPAALLKRSQELERRAIAKGAIVTNKVDSVFQDVVVEVPVIMMDTVVSLQHDTITFTKNNIETKILVRDKKIYINQVVSPKPIIVRQTVYITKTKTIKAGKTNFEYWSFGIGFLIFGFVLGAILSRLLWK